MRAPKVAELVAGHIRRQIVRGELSANDPLPAEAELMRHFEVSRPTLREAFRILESEGLIDVKRGARGGARVRLPTLTVAGRYVGSLLQVLGTTLDDVFGARVVIEPGAAGLVAARDDHVAAAAALGEVVDVEERVADKRAEYASAVARFHETLLELSQNNTLAVLAGVIGEIVRTSTSHVIVRDTLDSKDVSLANRAHRKLVALIGQGDAEGAEAYWRTHMVEVQRLYRRQYRSATVIDLFAGSD